MEMNKSQSNNLWVDFNSSQSSNTDPRMSNIWIQLGVHYVKEHYYLKGFLCFETALSLDWRSMDVKAYMIRTYIQAGKLQEAFELALEVNNAYGHIIEDHILEGLWSFA